MTEEEQIEPKRFIVVGAGGIGTWLCAGLVRLLEWKYPGSGLIIVDGDNYEGPFYVKSPFEREPDFAEESRNLSLNSLLKMAVSPNDTLEKS